MPNLSVQQANVLLDLARSLEPLERQIILSLRERGPGLLMEIAVRILRFPDEISGPVAALREKRLVQGSDFSGGPMGSELIALTPQGNQVATLLQEEAQQRGLRHAETAASVKEPAPDPRRQEADLLQKLGDLAERDGDLASASKYYRQALDVTRQLSAIDNDS